MIVLSSSGTSLFILSSIIELFSFTVELLLLLLILEDEIEEFVDGE